jgi:hypothetical protein
MIVVEADRAGQFMGISGSDQDTRRWRGGEGKEIARGEFKLGALGADVIDPQDFDKGLLEYRRFGGHWSGPGG